MTDTKIGTRNGRGRCPNHSHQQPMKGCLNRAEYTAGVVPNAPAILTTQSRKRRAAERVRVAA